MEAVISSNPALHVIGWFGLLKHEANSNTVAPALGLRLAPP